MNVLGIETSCDETAASVVQDGSRVLSNIVSSTLALHKKYGGVIPEIAARGHLEVIDFVVRRAITRAKIDFGAIDSLAVTSNPGLPGALLVGASFARALSFALRVPLLEVDHLQAHIYAPFLNKVSKASVPKFPLVALLVSGGHTSLFYFRSFKDFEILGCSRDDAAGEAFDKVAKILGLTFPGGPEIDRLAKSTDKPNLRFNCARLLGTFDFSFSGVKTGVLYFVKDWLKKNRASRKLPLRLKAEIASAFQNSVVSILVEKATSACAAKNVKDLIVAGGVAANSLLRLELSRACRTYNLRVHFAKPGLCVDNAAMVAGLAYQIMRRSKS